MRKPTIPFSSRYVKPYILVQCIEDRGPPSLKHIATGANPFVSSTVYRLVPFARVRPDVPAIVTDSSDALFERYAIDAAYKFKYKPRVIDGDPVESRGMLNKFTFVLEN